MPKSRINCPQCRQPITADVNQLFDVGQDPRLKQVILSGMFNLAQCPHCGYQGNLATPIVYHDPQKELLLTYFPPELGLPVHEQERLIGPMITQVTNNLPVEKRKAYLLRPRTMFTLQTMIETILEADGITKEMIDAQQKRLNLLQRLLESNSQESLEQMIKANDELIDADLMTLLNRLMASALSARDEHAARALNQLQSLLLSHSSFGREYTAQNAEVQEAVKSLQELGENASRAQILDLLYHAPNQTRLSALASLVRPALDYEFFTLLSARIDAAKDEERSKLNELRTLLLEITQRIDQALQQRSAQAANILNQVLQAPNIAEVVEQNIHIVDEFFVAAVNEQMARARKEGNLDKIAKLNQVVAVLEKASQSPKELNFIEELLEQPDEEAILRELELHQDQITPEFVEAVGQISSQMAESAEDQEVIAKLQLIYRLALRVSMRKQMNG
jgi:hypothetical protein